MLSFENIDKKDVQKTIVGVVDGGDSDCHILFLYDKHIESKKKNINTDFLYDIFNTNSKKNKITNYDLDILKNAIQFEGKPKNLSLCGKYEEAKSKHDDIKNDITIYKGKFIPMPDLNKDRCVWSFNGSSGSGKSFLASMIVNEYQAIFPKNPVILFSRCEKDPAFDKMKLTRIDIDETIESSDFTNLHDCLIIFDDIDTLPTVEIKKEEGIKAPKKITIDLSKKIQRIRDDILEAGRKTKISAICMSHQLFNYGKTRNMLLESDYITFFNRGSGVNHIKRFLKSHVGCDKKIEDKILKMTSRWTLISMHTFPKYVLGENEAFII
jgi:hypothetical protein